MPKITENKYIRELINNYSHNDLSDISEDI